jgi:hypothetical protein
VQNGPPDSSEVRELDPAPQIYALCVKAEGISEIAKRLWERSALLT